MSFSDYAGRKLHEVVFPGSHDAGVYGGGLDSKVATQKRDIYAQASAGVRWFDLRIATRSTGLRAYHGPKLISVPGGRQAVPLGDVGSDSLTDMLLQATKFVLQNSDEFLLLRFSKCGNMQEVVEKCIAVLGPNNQNVLPGTIKNLNTATVGELKGKVYVLVDSKDYNKLPVALRQPSHGIMPTKGLFNSKKGKPHFPYSENFPGVQYFGKYSNTNKVAKNLDKQTANLIAFQNPEEGNTAPEILGMMYWTLTSGVGKGRGLTDSIRSRNHKMWKHSSSEMQQAWRNIEQHIRSRGGDTIGRVSAGAAGDAEVGRQALKFKPNIVMIDFADRTRCNTIWQLNNTGSMDAADIGNGFRSARSN